MKSVAKQLTLCLFALVTMAFLAGCGGGIGAGNGQQGHIIANFNNGGNPTVSGGTVNLGGGSNGIAAQPTEPVPTGQPQE